MEDERAVVTSNERVAEDFYRARLAAPAIARQVEPGQFVEVQVAQDFSPYLRLPLSVGQRDVEAGTIDLLYEAVGPKTAALSRLQGDTDVACLGPLGHGFHEPAAGAAAVLVGGGIGIPPLLFLGDYLRRGGCRVILLIGARNAGKHLPPELLEPAADEVLLATDDGSKGHQGFVTELLPGAVERTRDCAVYCCGPYGMMAAVAAACRDLRLPCQVSLEEYMACGIGVCVGCVVETAKPSKGDDASPYNRYSRICLDGPVYDAESVCW